MGATKKDFAGMTGDELAAQFAQVFSATNAITERDLGRHLKAVIDGMIAVVGPRIDTLESEVASLTAIVKEAETKAAESLEYYGVWAAGTYRKGACVTSGGHLWIARRLTSHKPGDGGGEASGWTMAVRRGSDGKDGR